MKYRQYTHPPTWTEYVMALVERFGVDYDDPMEELKKIKQTGFVREYQAIFERNLTRVNLSQENAISCFLEGLTEELNLVVKLTNPITLSQVYKTARMQEAYLVAHAKALKQTPLFGDQNYSSKRVYSESRGQNKPLLPTPYSSVPPVQKGVNRRRLSVEEMNEKRAQGLCYFCTEKYVPGHTCKNLKQLYILEVEEQDDYLGQGEDNTVEEEWVQE